MHCEDCQDLCPSQLWNEYCALRRQDQELNAACTTDTNTVLQSGGSDNDEQQDEQLPLLRDGLTSLYIGHSFGHPFASELPRFTTSMGINHTQEIVSSGGQTGTPVALWYNWQKRAEIKTILDRGETDLLIMICCSEDFIDTGVDEGILNWMDYALLQNPNTSFAFAMPWVSFPEKYENATLYASYWDHGYSLWLNLMNELHSSYPEVALSTIPHGKAAVELVTRFENDMLPEINDMTGRGTDTLFKDEIGHAGQMLLDLGTLIWLGTIYDDVDVSAYSFDENVYQTNLTEIAGHIIEDESYSSTLTD